MRGDEGDGEDDCPDDDGGDGGAERNREGD